MLSTALSIKAIISTGFDRTQEYVFQLDIAREERQVLCAQRFSPVCNGLQLSLVRYVLHALTGNARQEGKGNNYIEALADNSADVHLSLYCGDLKCVNYRARDKICQDTGTVARIQWAVGPHHERGETFIERRNRCRVRLNYRGVCNTWVLTKSSNKYISTGRCGSFVTRMTCKNTPSRRVLMRPMGRTIQFMGWSR